MQKDDACQAAARLAADALNEAKAAKLSAVKVEEQEVNAGKLVSQLRGELQTAQIEKEEQRHFWVTSQRASSRAEEEAVASEARWARQQVANEEAAAREAIAAARSTADKASSQRNSEATRTSELLQKLME